jgi:dephospho-CoA kinase
VWVVISSYDKRAERVTKRDDMSKNRFEKIASCQVTDDERLSFATDVIYNDGSIEELGERVDQLYDKLP